jgi:hypothetical protein
MIGAHNVMQWAQMHPPVRKHIGMWIHQYYGEIYGYFVSWLWLSPFPGRRFELTFGFKTWDYLHYLGWSAWIIMRQWQLGFNCPFRR